MLLIFSGYNQRAVVAFLRCLEKNRIKDYGIVACSSEDPILGTSYLKKVKTIRKKRELDKTEIFSILKEQRKQNDSVVVVPSTEALDRFLIEYRSELDEIGITIPIVNKKLYEKVSNKIEFYELCKQYRFLVPPVKEIGKEYFGAYVAKPNKYQSMAGEKLNPVLVKSSSEHQEFIDKYNLDDFSIQEFISGESYYLLYYLSKSGKDYAYSQRNCAQQPGGKSMIAAIEASIYHEKISKEYVSMLREIGYFGFIMIELRKSDAGYYMIEANPRLWGPTQLYVDAGIPLIEAFLYDVGAIKKVPKSQDSEKKAFYYWSGGIKNDILTEKNITWLDGGREIVEEFYDSFIKADIYKRNDTMNIYELEKVM